MPGSWGSYVQLYEHYGPWADYVRAGARPGVDGPADEGSLVLRTAGEFDAAALGELAAVDCAPPLAGPVLLAEVDGALWAALALDDDRALADPFRRTAALVALLRARAAQLRSAGRPSRARGWAVRPRWARA